MASRTSTLPRHRVPPGTRPRGRYRPRPEPGASGPVASRAALGWPADGVGRWLIRLAFAAPFAVLAVVAYSHRFSDGSNAALVARGKLINWGSADLSFVAHVYPPLPTAIAALVPNAVALGIIGALCAGTILEVVGCKLARRGFPLWGVLVLTAALGASPGFALTATSDLASLLTLTFLVLSLDSFLRFAVRGNTHSGFVAGLAVGAASLCDPVAVLCVIGYAAAAPLIAHRRFRDEPAAGRATAAVLMFPTFAGLAGWTFLCWRFTGSPLAWLHTAAPAIWDRHNIAGAMAHVALPLALTPVFLFAVVVLVVQRHPLPALGIFVPFLVVLASTYIGLAFPPASTAVLLGVIGLAALPSRPSRKLLMLACAIALAGLAAKWSYPASGPLLAWEHALGVAWRALV